MDLFKVLLLFYFPFHPGPHVYSLTTPRNTLSNECLQPCRSPCILSTVLFWVRSYLGVLLLSVSCSLILFFTSSHWTLCLQDTTEVPSALFVQDFWAPQHWIHLCSRDGHTGGLPLLLSQTSSNKHTHTHIKRQNAEGQYVI